MDVCSCLRGQVGENPEKIALFGDDEVMSYGALDRSSTELARWFLRQGLSRGDRVALHWSNSIEAVQLFFGIFKAGLIAVTVNTRLKPSEIGYILDHSGSRMCFSEPALATGSGQAGAACPILTKLPPLESVEPPAALPALDLDQPAVILYTSGTTAHPKGVIHTHRSLLPDISDRGLVDHGVRSRRHHGRSQRTPTYARCGAQRAHMVCLPGCSPGSASPVRTGGRLGFYRALRMYRTGLYACALVVRRTGAGAAAALCFLASDGGIGR